MENNEVNKCANEVFDVLMKYEENTGLSVIASLLTYTCIRFNLSKSEFLERIGPCWDKIQGVSIKQDLRDIPD